VRWSGRLLTVFDDPGPGGKGYRSRLFIRTATGWSPPLPPDIEVPPDEEMSRSISRSASS
jgi:hypothetical protein